MPERQKNTKGRHQEDFQSGIFKQLVIVRMIIDDEIGKNYEDDDGCNPNIQNMIMLQTKLCNYLIH